jgi:hypothetical protein
VPRWRLGGVNTRGAGRFGLGCHFPQWVIVTGGKVCVVVRGMSRIFVRHSRTLCIAHPQRSESVQRESGMIKIFVLLPSLLQSCSGQRTVR